MAANSLGGGDITIPLQLRASAACMETAHCFHAVADSSCLLIGSLTGDASRGALLHPTTAELAAFYFCPTVHPHFCSARSLRDSLLIDHMNKSSEIWAHQPRTRVTLPQMSHSTAATTPGWLLSPEVHVYSCEDWSTDRSVDRKIMKRRFSSKTVKHFPVLSS